MEDALCARLRALRTLRLRIIRIDAGVRESAGAAITTAPPMTAGIFIGTSHFLADAALGSIDDVQIWRRVLSPSEIKELAR